MSVSLRQLRAGLGRQLRLVEEELVKEWADQQPDAPSLTTVPSRLLKPTPSSPVSLPLELWKVDQLQRSVSSIKSDYTTQTEWSVSLIPITPLPTTTEDENESSSVRADLQFSTGSDGRVSDLGVSYSSEGDQGLLLLPSELRPLEEHATESAEVDLYLRALHGYLTRSARRLSHARGRLGAASFLSADGGSPGLTIVLRGEVGSELGRMFWQLRFSEREEGFVDEYRVELTAKGVTAADECNFPDELLASGRVSFWDAETALTNLAKMTSLSGTSEQQEEESGKKGRKDENSVKRRSTRGAATRK